MAKRASRALSWWVKECRKYGASLPRVIKAKSEPLEYYTERLRSGVMSQLPVGTQDNSMNRVEHIQRIASQAMDAFNAAITGDDILAAAQVGEYIDEFRRALEPQMPALLKLCDSPLGFRTDRSPEALARNKAKGNGPTTPYHPRLIKECILEGFLHGVNPLNDQMNIISGRCYIALNGYNYLLSKASINNLRYEISPEKLTDTEHVAAAHAKWTLDGRNYEMKKRFFVKAFKGSTWEQTEGKVARKLKKAVYERVTNRAFQEEESDMREESIPVESQVVEEADGPTDPPLDADAYAPLIERLMEDSKIPVQDFLAYMVETGAIDKSIQSVKAFCRVQATLAPAIIRSWRTTAKRIQEQAQARKKP